jgi:hypothetical protein
MSENTKPNLNVLEEEFTTGEESARDIPNAQVGEAIQGSTGYPGSSEELGDVGNFGTAEETRQQEEAELGVDDANSSRATN